MNRRFTLLFVVSHLGRPKPARLHDLAYTVSRSYRPGLECLAIVASSHEDLRAKIGRARDELPLHWHMVKKALWL